MSFFSTATPAAKGTIQRPAVGIAFMALAAFLLVGVFWKDSSPKDLPRTDEPHRTSQPAPVADLAKDYSSLARPKAVPAYISPPPPRNELSEEEKARRLRAIEARKGGVTFSNLTIDSLYQRTVPSSLVAGQTEGAEEIFANSPRDDVNRQDDKIRFVKTKRNSPHALNQPVYQPFSDYELKAGTVIPGVLLTGINSDLPGQIVGQVSQNVYDTVRGRYLLIPQGTKAIGEYDSRVVYGQSRVLLVWTRLIFPDGSSISLEGMPGIDLTGYSGLSDQVNNHYLRLLSGVVLSSLLSASAQVAQGRTYDSINPPFADLAAQGAAQNINQVGQQITNRNLNIQPTLEIRPGFRFNILVNKDLLLNPYSEN